MPQSRSTSTGALDVGSVRILRWLEHYPFQRAGDLVVALAPWEKRSAVYRRLANLVERQLFDEKLVTLHADVRTPLPAKPGQPERIDYEYERLGTANLFFMVEPLGGWHHVEVTERRTKLDYAEQICWLIGCILTQNMFGLSRTI